VCFIYASTSTLSLGDIGRRLSIDPFDVGLRLKRAWLELRDRLTRTIVAFRARRLTARGRAPHRPPPEPARRDGTGVRPSDGEKEVMSTKSTPTIAITFESPCPGGWTSFSR